MKKEMILFFVMGLFGCASGQFDIRDHLNGPGILQDSLYRDYQQQEDAWESRYLSGEISYADYLHKKGEIENEYQKEADKRDMIIRGSKNAEFLMR